MNQWLLDNQYLKIVGRLLDLNLIRPKSVQMEAIKQQIVESIFQKNDVFIENEASGKPFLNESNWNVSVSHSNKWLFIQVAKDFQPGIDIEPIRDKIIKIAPRFLNESDRINLSLLPQLLGLHLIWGAKECIYKSYSLRGLDFRNEIFIELPSEINTLRTFSGYILKNNQRQDFKLNWEIVLHQELLVYIKETSEPILPM
jgi:hypothetical protein